MHLPFPLSERQKLIWLGQRIAGDVPLYNMAMRHDLIGAISADVFSQAFDIVVSRSDNLRTTLQSEDTDPLQAVRADFDSGIEILDFGCEDNPLRRAESWMDSKTRQRIDLTARNFECALLKIDENLSIWYFSQHHLFTDISSLEIIFRNVGRCYQALKDGDNPDDVIDILNPENAGFVASDGGDNDTAGTAPSSRDDSAPITLYGAHKKTSSSASRRLTLSLDKNLDEDINRLARDPDFATLSPALTRYCIFATAFTAYIHRISNSHAISLGTPLHNRYSVADKSTPGLFIQIAGLQIEVEEEDSFKVLYKKTRQCCLDLLKNSQYSDTVRVSRHCNIVLNYIDTRFDQFGDCVCKTYWLDNGHVDPHHDLRMQVLQLNASEPMQVFFDLRAEALDASLADQTINHFHRLLQAMLSAPDRPIGHVSLTAQQDRPLPHSRGNTPHYCDTWPLNGTITKRIRAVAKDNPHAVAVRQDERSLTYGDLLTQIDVFRERIAACRTPECRSVGIHMDRSIELIIAVLGSMEAGLAYVPLETSQPSERLAKMVTAASVGLLVSDQSDGDQLAQHLGVPFLPFVSICSSNQIAGDGGMTLNPDGIAYTIFTSGSTGEPKGVSISHASLYEYVRWASKQYILNDACDFAFYSAFGFDLTVTSLFVPLCNGGCIVVYPNQDDGIDLSVATVVERDEVDIIKLTPAHLALIENLNLKNRRAHSLIVGGDNLTTAVAGRVHQTFADDTRIFNEYGPTEATVGCMIHEFEPLHDTEDSVPIGQAADGMEIYLLDDGGNPVPPGVVGEMYISGARLAEGYVNRPDLTQAQFPHLEKLDDLRCYKTGDLARKNASGDLIYLGRKDNQVKVGGVRIETAEVSAALSKISGIHDAVVVPIKPDARETLQDVQYCERCGLASTYPDSMIDSEGVCQFCLDFEDYRERAQDYFKTMSQLETRLRELSRRKTGSYDCMMLLSGGKDSTYALHQVAALGLNIYCFTLDNGYISEGAKDNIRRSTDELGLTHEFATTEFMNAIFADSLERHASVCYGCFKTIYTLAINRAQALGIPVIVTGLSRGQFFETRLTKSVFVRSTFDPDEIDRDVLEARKVYHRVPDTVTSCLNMDLFETDDIFEQVEFVDFYRYCDVSMSELYAYLDSNAPWLRPKDTGRSTNCLINDTGIHVHKQKLGYHNYALPYSWDVRLGHKERDAALQELNDHIDVEAVHGILAELDFPLERVYPAHQDTRLAAYYQSGATAPEPEALREMLREQLPANMIPAHLVPMDALPLNVNGKVDISQLPNPIVYRRTTRSGYTPPGTPLQKTMVNIWRETLHLYSLGIKDNFFDLGGDSIIAIQLVAKAASQGINFTPSHIFMHQTIEKLALVCEQDSDTQESTAKDSIVAFDMIDADTRLEDLASMID
ncbi:MAG: amino acid adenylation domain-containing protein [Pseudomonadota bacterium]